MEEAQRNDDAAALALVFLDQKFVLKEREVSEERYYVIGIIEK